MAEGDGEARARARKAAALPAEVAGHYESVRFLRGAGAPDPVELARLRDAVAGLPGEWLLREEVDEITVGSGSSAPPPS